MFISYHVYKGKQLKEAFDLLITSEYYQVQQGTQDEREVEDDADYIFIEEYPYSTFNARVASIAKDEV
jgi:hypothetical protein